MSPVSLVLNLIWIVFGGGLMAVGWLVVGVIFAISIIGLPWARSAFEIAGYTLFPFGRQVIDRGTSGFGFIGNIIWFVFAGWWLALGHVVSGILCAVTVIGLPLAVAHFKLVRISLAPIGLTVVNTDR